MQASFNLPLFVSKVIIVVVFSVVAGLALHNESVADFKKGSELTIEKYTAEYETYREKLLDNKPESEIFSVFIFLLIFAAIVVAYEALVWLLSFPVKFVLTSLSRHDSRQGIRL